MTKEQIIYNFLLFHIRDLNKKRGTAFSRWYYWRNAEGIAMLSGSVDDYIVIHYSFQKLIDDSFPNQDKNILDSVLMKCVKENHL